jgi:hypothetical protein
MKPGINEAIIEGVLYEKITRTFDDAIAGEFIIEVPITIDGDTYNSLIPVSFYTKPITNAGKPNTAYKGIKTIIDSAKALNEVDGDYTKADRIRLRNGTLGENMFFAADDRFVSFARIRGNFFDRVKESDCAPKAQFKVKMIVGNIQNETIKQNGEDEETGRLIVTGQVVQYNGEIDEIKFVVQNKKHIDIVNKGWSIGDTVTANGVIKYVTVEVTNETKEEDGFGDPVVNTSTRRLREYIITGGSTGPVEGYEEEEIAEARRSRKMRINVIKEKQAEKEKESSKTAAAKNKTRDW